MHVGRPTNRAALVQDGRPQRIYWPCMATGACVAAGALCGAHMGRVEVAAAACHRLAIHGGSLLLAGTPLSGTFTACIAPVVVAGLLRIYACCSNRGTDDGGEDATRGSTA